MLTTSMGRAGAVRRHQQGVALLVILCVVLVLLILGATGTRAALYAEKAARGERDHGIALHAAEAALTDAERDIEGGSNPASLRAAMFDPGVADVFPEGCGAGAGNPALGLCKRVLSPRIPAWLLVPLADPSAEIAAVDYGTFTGSHMPVGRASLPVRLPRYIIEPLPFARAGSSASVAPASLFRITAIGFGVRHGTHVVLQSFYLKAHASGEEA
ncbi:pilus assembly protein [Massilia sp. PAMC28688]|uniref:pilus assembly PilX family protein n=1 Tax=Massilia sp. PAMC28688 TaxID=2861283 RepID=UPI001C62E617|nr:PilX N-terminal domain-containing pilus assembly protein [Massilia sp. PAMC28688]QYF93888.1 pilus assembly protein [Massilia sp. PAMC28688]